MDVSEIAINTLGMGTYAWHRCWEVVINVEMGGKGKEVGWEYLKLRYVCVLMNENER